MTEDVVVAVDGGTASESALEWAIDRARSVDMRLEITSVVDIDWIPQIGPDPVIAEHERIVSEAGRKVEASGVDVPVSTTVHHHRPIQGLIEASRRADLLVIGTHKSSRAVGLIYGTLPLAIAARTLSPLVIVPVGWEPRSGPVVVGVDDETGTAAMAFGAAEAHRRDVSLLAIRAWSVPPLVYGAGAAIESRFDEFSGSQRAVLDAMVAPIRAQHERLDIDALLEYGHPSVILAERAKHGQLTVVGTHGRGAIAGLLLGSVGHDLLMNMPSPVVVVPDAGRRDEPLEHSSEPGAND